ncbi:phosphatidate cytidylyltransferase [Streptomyces huiliensis]|uniref:phosphatidate cytidylyltransferase n=1 Tax=Streptomyces huiliensis TaxID=2876027 RepID=UPI001CC06FAA|nr:phosphatidate cytidylyltransferase [Streptomyces huiliensis]MBZ4321572.1 phosphatidate cytidylyltransferase [Streptomyces huiliensis]
MIAIRQTTEVVVPETGEDRTASGRAGRNLYQAVTVGVLLGAVVCTALATTPLVFAVLIGIALTMAIVELARGLRRAGVHVAVFPLHLGSQATLWLCWRYGEPGLLRGLAAAVLLCLAWRVARGPADYVRDASASVLLLGYICLPACCAVLLEERRHGALLLVCVLACVSASDTAGYAVGALLGRHRMAPAISPGKSWEGFAGSLLTSTAVGALALGWVGRAPWPAGALFGLLIALAAVGGDLVESTVKRDLGIKDMSALLPGHGGLMDRLDSVLPAMVTAWIVLR